MADVDVKFSIEEARQLVSEMRKMREEIAELRRTSLRTIPDTPHFELLLDGVRVARDVGEEPTTSTGNAAGLALASVARWATNVQAFSILVKAELWTEAYGVARMGSELAINLVWVAEGGPRAHFPDAESRAIAMVQDGRDSARTWFEGMEAAGATLRTRDGRTWHDLVADAKPVQHFPSFTRRAECTSITKGLWTFAYRGESTAVHSTPALLASHAAGEPPLAPHLIVHNVLVASFLVFAAGANLLQDERLAAIARRLEAAHKSDLKHVRQHP